MLASCFLCGDQVEYVYLYEIEITAERGAGCIVAFERCLADHDDSKADERCEREQHRREDTRETSDFAHDSG